MDWWLLASFGYVVLWVAVFIGVWVGIALLISGGEPEDDDFVAAFGMLVVLVLATYITYLARSESRPKPPAEAAEQKR